MSPESDEADKRSELTTLAARELALCPRCGAKLTSSFAACWLCLDKPENHNSVKVDSPATQTYVAGNDSNSSFEGIYTAILAICAVMTVLIGIGLTIQSPELLVPYLFLLGPILIASGVHGSQQIVTTGHIQPRSLFKTVMIASLTVFALVAALIVAFVIFLLVICMPMLHGEGH